jgi:hypothetical protein
MAYEGYEEPIASSGSIDMPFGADYNGTAEAPALESGFSVGDMFDKLLGAGITRAAYEINKPLYDAAGKQRSPDGLMGKIGSFGVSQDTQRLLILLAVIAGVVYLAPKFFE